MNQKLLVKIHPQNHAMCIYLYIYKYMSIFVVSPKHDVSLEKCNVFCLLPNSIASFFQLFLLKPLGFFLGHDFDLL